MVDDQLFQHDKQNNIQCVRPGHLESSQMIISLVDHYLYMFIKNKEYCFHSRWEIDFYPRYLG